MNTVIAAMSAPAQMNGISRHPANLARALLSTKAILETHFVAGAWQKEMYRGALGACDPRLHTHWIQLRDANVSRLSWYYCELSCIAAQLEADFFHLSFPAPTAMEAYPCATVLTLHDLYPFDIPCNFGRLRSVLARHIVAKCVRHVDAITCVSCVSQAEFLTRFPELEKNPVANELGDRERSASGAGRISGTTSRSPVSKEGKKSRQQYAR